MTCPSDMCNDAGTCDFSTGNCSDMIPKSDGTDCDDGDANTPNDMCNAGVCSGGSQIYYLLFLLNRNKASCFARIQACISSRAYNSKAQLCIAKSSLSFFFFLLEDLAYTALRIVLCMFFLSF